MNSHKNRLYETFHMTFLKVVSFSRHIAACLILIYLVSGIYSISSNEIGILQRFGKVIGDKIQPGIHIMLPWPIDRITKVPTRVVNRILIDDFFIGSTGEDHASNTFSDMTGLDSYCLTGDNNLINIMCVIQYNIFEPVKYEFCVRNPEIMLKNMACNTIIHSMASMPIDEALTRGKEEMVYQVKSALQKRLDMADTGVSVSFVEISSIKPPDRVQEAFSDVVRANIDREKMINDAEAYRNEKLPAANADAARALQGAEGYKTEVVLKAEGDTDRFSNLLNQARTEGNSVRQMIYIETAKEIMKNVGNKHLMIYDEKGKAPARLTIFNK